MIGLFSLISSDKHTRSNTFFFREGICPCHVQLSTTDIDIEGFVWGLGLHWLIFTQLVESLSCDVRLFACVFLQPETTLKCLLLVEECFPKISNTKKKLLLIGRRKKKKKMSSTLYLLGGFESIFWQYNKYFHNKKKKKKERKNTF